MPSKPRKPAQQLAYRYALKAVGFVHDAPQRALHVFRDPDLFYHYPTRC